MAELQLKITPAGRAALVNAANTGTLPVTVSHIGVTATGFTPGANPTSLPGELKRLTTFAGQVVADDTIHVTLRDDSADTYSLRGFALYLADGTLFAIYGQAGVILEKSAQAMLLLSTDVKFVDVTATSLTFGDASFANPPATATVAGVTQHATNPEALTGTATNRSIVASALKYVLDQRFGAGAPSVLMKSILSMTTAAAIRLALELKSAALSEASDFATAGHGHAIAGITGLQTALDGKQPAGSYAAAGHGHAIAQIAGLQDALDGKQPTGNYAAATHSHDAGAIVTGVLHLDRIPELPQSRIANLTTDIAAALRRDVAQNALPAAATDWRIGAGSSEGADVLQLRLQSGGAFSTTRGAILELNGANAAGGNAGGWRLLGAPGSQSVISGGAGSTVLFQTATYNFTSALQVNGNAVWHAGNFASNNIPTQIGDLLVSKTSAVVGVGASGGRNGGLANYGAAETGQVGLFSDYAGGVLYLRPEGRLVSTGQMLISAAAITWRGWNLWHEGNFDPATKAAASHTHSAGDITSGTFAPARISSASVTQHQGALAIDWTQVFNAGSLGEWRTIPAANKVNTGAAFADAAGTNPEYRSGGSGFDCNNMLPGTRALVSQTGNSNLPVVSGVGFWYIECRNSYTGATTLQQTAFAYLGGSAEMCIRHFQGGNWSPWARVWNSANFDPATKANLASPTFTGDPKAPTPATSDNDTTIATTAFVKAALAAALADYLPKHNPTFTGTMTGPAYNET